MNPYSSSSNNLRGYIRQQKQQKAWKMIHLEELGGCQMNRECKELFRKYKKFWGKKRNPPNNLISTIEHEDVLDMHGLFIYYIYMLPISLLERPWVAYKNT